MTKRQVNRPRGASDRPARSVRISDSQWTKAKRRASYDGYTISAVAAMLIEGYADGKLNLPKITKTYE